jgi:hypothetical protein
MGAGHLSSRGFLPGSSGMEYWSCKVSLLTCLSFCLFAAASRKLLSYSGLIYTTSLFGYFSFWVKLKSHSIKFDQDNMK